jgi:exodeoxyribonuclease I
MKQTYLFYDIESTGLNPCFDQVVQFAAIRTDLELNEISRHELRIALNPDIIPSPEAILVHQQGISQMRQGVSEYEGIKTIHKWFNHPGTISLGYNTLGFDDEFLRFSFYRNLLSPYSHQFANQCRRMDVYPLTVMYYLFCKDALTWPTVDNKVSLRLENLNTCNGLAEGMAHDAMVDVLATVELARRLKQHPEMWDYCCGYMQKETDLSRINQLKHRINLNASEHSLAYVVNGKIGQAANYIAPVLNLGQHNVYKNQSLWLRLDQKAFNEIEPKNLAESLFVLKKKPAEDLFILPYLDRYHSHISDERQQYTQNNLNWLQKNTGAFNQLKQHHKNYTYPAVESIDADAALYDLPFTSRQQQSVMEKFHRADPQDKTEILNTLHHPTQQELGNRLLCKHFGEYCNDDQHDSFSHHQTRVFCAENNGAISDYRNRHKLSAHQALENIENLYQAEERSADDLKLLKELKYYIEEKIAETI